MRSSGGSMRSSTAAARWRTISSTPIARAGSTGASSCAGARCSAWAPARSASWRARAGPATRAAARRDAPSSDQQSQGVQKGGKVTAAINAPAGAIDPITVADDGSLAVLAQCGEYLVWSDSELNAVPRLAESWEPNEDASVWTFKIRQGVKFHDGKEMTAEDVAASINRLADPDSASQALSAFTGFLTKDSAKATDATDGRVLARGAERLVPLPAELGQLQHDHPARRLRRRLREDHERDGAVHPRASSRRARARRSARTRSTGTRSASRTRTTTEIRFYGKEQARVLALQSGEVDVVTQFSVSGGRALLTDPNVQTVDAEGHDAPPGAPAHGQGPVQGQARAPGARAVDRPQRARRRPVQGPARSWATTRRSRRCSRTRTRASPSASRTSRRPSSCSPTRAWPTASRSSSTRGTASRSPTSRS